MNAPPQGIHQIDDIAWRFFGLGDPDFLAARLATNQLPKRGFITVLELAGFEVPGLAVEDMLGKPHRVLGDFRAWDSVEIILLVADLIVIAQRRTQDTLAEGFERDD